MLKLADRFFHPEEADWIRQGEIRDQFFRIWTAREAWAKYNGTGLDGIPAADSLLPCVRAGLQTGETVQNGQGAGSWTAIPAELRWHAAPEGYLLCTCAAGTRPEEKTVYNYCRM